MPTLTPFELYLLCVICAGCLAMSLAISGFWVKGREG